MCPKLFPHLELKHKKSHFDKTDFSKAMFIILPKIIYLNPKIADEKWICGNTGFAYWLSLWKTFPSILNALFYNTSLH